MIASVLVVTDAGVGKHYNELLVIATSDVVGGCEQMRTYPKGGSQWSDTFGTSPPKEEDSIGRSSGRDHYSGTKGVWSLGHFGCPITTAAAIL